MARVAVVDIGKTNAKVALVETRGANLPVELRVEKAANRPRLDGMYPHHDVDALWTFILDALRSLRAETPIEAISVTTHGATCALLNDGGELAMPVLDYEYEGPAATRAEYDRYRPSFEETGSPALPAGLNLGSQLFWLCRTWPDHFSQIATIVTYPQYWAYRLCGVAANEVTSLGCHTDMWNPAAADYSSLVARMGWRELMAPLSRAHDRLGQVTPDVVRRTGLKPDTPVYCGIHDSNASLLPHLCSLEPPYTVVSSGTWCVAMAVGGSTIALDEARDTLVNVSAFGDMVPSARFMGGREYEILTNGGVADWTERDVAAVLDGGIMLFPSVQVGCGPFAGQQASWVGGRVPTPAERTVAISFYLALMTATCVDLIGGQGTTVVEGSLGGDLPFSQMLAAATRRPVRSERLSTGTSIGAALLTLDARRLHRSRATGVDYQDLRFRNYARQWRESAELRSHRPQNAGTGDAAAP